MRTPGVLALLLICSSATAENSMTRDGRLLKTYAGFVHTETHSGQACKVLRASDGQRYAIFGRHNAATGQVTSLRGQLVRLSRSQCGTNLGILIPSTSKPASAEKKQTVQGLVRRQNMEGNCWMLQTHDGNQYELKGGDTNMYRDGQYVMIPADSDADVNRGDCGIGPVLEVTDYYVLEPGLQRANYVLNRPEQVSTIRD
jgi:hypothetical protein